LTAKVVSTEFAVSL